LCRSVAAIPVANRVAKFGGRSHDACRFDGGEKMAIDRNTHKALKANRGVILPLFVKQINVTDSVRDRDTQMEIAPNVKVSLGDLAEWLSKQASGAIWWVKAGVTAAVIGAIGQIAAVALTLIKYH
jgi:hypothetical protein